LPEEKKFIIDNAIGGVILFGRNISDLITLSKLMYDLHDLNKQLPSPLFIGVDMEGGRVQRLKEPFTIWPSVRKMSDLNSTTVAFNFAEFMGKELVAIGFNVNFAPSCDILTNPKNQVIGDRSPGSDPEHVAKISSALARGYIKSGLIACAKHFPGHGDTLLDSHHELPIQDNTTLEMLEAREFIPFRKTLRARVDMVMSAHILFPKIDSEWPATLSPVFMKVLRESFKFQKIIVTDDLGMKALTKTYSTEQIAVQALKCGVNMLLYCNELDTPPKAIEAVEKAVKDKKVNNIDASLAIVTSVKKEKLSNFKPMLLVDAQKIIGCEDHKRLAQNILDGVVTKI
jgi:beta-N-acetylhexosaminidase